jgi:CRP-like cAMP-binding protein
METVLETDHEFVCDIHSPCFQSLTSDEIEMVRSSKTQVLFRKGDNLTKQGTFTAYVLFVISGLVKQYIEGDQHKSFNLRIIKPGEFIGLSSVFSNQTFNYSSVALTDCQAYLIEKNTIKEIMMQNGGFGLGIIKRYCEQNTNLFESLGTVLYKQMNGRMAETLLYLNGLKKEFPDIFQLLSRKDIANFAGVSTESAVKLLKSFEKENWIVLTDKDIQIVETAALEDISRRG